MVNALTEYKQSVRKTVHNGRITVSCIEGRWTTKSSLCYSKVEREAQKLFLANKG